ncbi:MAG: radical SAM protein [Planctomycetes bacterium]|nr:radical SAM protein [Planctomycetota bacterium]
MGFLKRTARHARLIRRARDQEPQETPPFLILFINSICNLACDHCFYWKELNARDDLSRDEIFALADSLGPIENLNLSGGEPFLRKEFAEICRYFVTTNGVKQIYCPTNGYYRDRTHKQLTELFEERALQLFAVELSLDGMPEYHNTFRRDSKSFEKAMETYDMLAEMQEQEPRLQIHAISTATGENIDEIKRLTTYLFERCPKMSHHNIAMIRGERKRPTLVGPQLEAYKGLVHYMARLWSERESGRFGSIVDPMLHWGKEQIARAQDQAIPCRAGILTGVVYANGDVSLCEQHEPIGNLRKHTFPEIWNSESAVALRKSIRCKECFCTNEVFLWPSIVFQPNQLRKAFFGSKAWRRHEPLPKAERVDPFAGPTTVPHDEEAQKE